jgi:predicted DNA binding CopG/RHH family protein
VDQIKEAWDDVDWCDLEADDDFIQKSLSIVAGEDYDTRVSIPIDLPDHELMAIFKMAHEADMTFNDFVEKILREKLADEGFVAGMKAAHEAGK